MMLLEVVSMKVPVIASDIPSNKAVFFDGELLFFKSNDSEDLKEKLQYALKNPNEMRNKAEAAYQKVSKEYTWRSVAKQYSMIFKTLMK